MKGYTYIDIENLFKEESFGLSSYPKPTDNWPNSNDFSVSYGLNISLTMYAYIYKIWGTFPLQASIQRWVLSMSL